MKLGRFVIQASPCEIVSSLHLSLHLPMYNKLLQDSFLRWQALQILLLPALLVWCVQFDCELDLAGTIWRLASKCLRKLSHARAGRTALSTAAHLKQGTADIFFDIAFL
mgnify:FL=1